MRGLLAYEGSSFSPPRSLGLTWLRLALALCPTDRRPPHTTLRASLPQGRFSSARLLRPHRGRKMTVTTGRDRHCTCRAQLPGLSGRWGPAGTLWDSWGSRRLPGDRGLEEPSKGCPRKTRDSVCVRQTWKRARPVAGPGAAPWLQWKIPTRGENSIQQIFMAPSQYKEEGQAESLGMALCWHHALLSEGPSGSLEQKRGWERVQEPGRGRRSPWAQEIPQPRGDPSSAAPWAPSPWQRTAE